MSTTKLIRFTIKTKIKGPVVLAKKFLAGGRALWSRRGWTTGPLGTLVIDPVLQENSLKIVIYNNG